MLVGSYSCSVHCGLDQLADRCVGFGRPALGGGGEGESAAVADVVAALPCDERVEHAEGDADAAGDGGAGVAG